MNEVINTVWCEKYRPQTIDECILPDRIKNDFKKFLKTKSFPNLLLAGSAGTGKTTVAKALLMELDFDFIVINASDERNIDVVRHRIRTFASQRSLDGKNKAIILDEADGLSPIAQPALRAVMEEFHKVRFILTCNFKTKLIEPLHSRTSSISFNIKTSEKKLCSVLFLKRIIEICAKENVEADVKVLAAVVQKYYPDNRRILNEIQRYAQSGSIDSGMLMSLEKTDVKELVKYCKEKNLDSCRSWVVNNLDTDPGDLFTAIYEGMYSELQPSFIPDFIILVGEYQYKAAFVANQEINMVAFIANILSSIEFK